MRSLGLAWGVLLFVVGLTGCVTTSPYPPDWPAMSEVAQGRCPRIDGRYLNAEVSESQGCFAEGSTYTPDCDLDLLSSNILSGRRSELDRGRASRWVQFRQPDDNTLVIEFEKGGARVVLKQSDGEFTCGNEGLTLSSSRGASWLGQTGLRSFRPLEDGSLLMKRTTHERSFYPLFVPPIIVPIPIPQSVTDTNYVRWPALALDQENKPVSH